jgi:hypothetical protein
MPVTPADKKLRPCFNFQRGTCPKSADECEYAHRKMTSEEEKLYQSRSRSSSRSTSGGKGKGRGRGKGGSRSGEKLDHPCKNWSRTGRCAYGDGCKFQHNRPAVPASGSPSPESTSRRSRKKSPRNSDTGESSSSS